MNKIEQQMHMYGCETTELDSLMSEAIIIGEERDLPMLAMSILSDAQHVMARRRCLIWGASVGRT